MIQFAPLLLKLSALKPIIQKYWKELIVVGMAFMLWYQNFSDTRFLLWIETIPSLEARLQEQVDANQICKDGNDKLSAAINENNEIIEEWKKLDAQHRLDIAELKGKLAEKRKQTEEKVDTVLKGKTPTTCEESIQYLREGIGEIKW